MSQVILGQIDEVPVMQPDGTTVTVKLQVVGVARPTTDQPAEPTAE